MSFTTNGEYHHDEIVETSVGRVIFKEVIPTASASHNEVIDKKKLGNIV